MNLRVAIAGGGIGGLAAALAMSRSGCDAVLYEKAAAFAEIGAGIQLGPNVTRILDAWGLLDDVQRLGTAPGHLQIRSATNAAVLGELQLGQAMLNRYGSPYLTVHRADLHSLLLHAVRQTSTVVQTNCALQSFQQNAQGVSLQTGQGLKDVDVLAGADGLWSNTRLQLLNDGPPRRTGHLAFRALVRQLDLPHQLRSQNIIAWLGPSMHAVQYPVRTGEWLNVVVFIHGEMPGDLQNWDHTANAVELKAAVQESCASLQDLMQAIPDWRLWVMHDRPAIEGPHQMAQGRVALLGDAAHPMRPYLAQGAGMAIEDAAELGLALKGVTLQNAPAALQHYAATRWQRNATVQARALRNGQIFHATGLTRWGRDAAMKMMGEQLLDMAWLYGYWRSTEVKTLSHLTNYP